MSGPVVIGLSGRAGTGKDYLVKNVFVPMFCPNQPYAILSLADSFKIEAIVKGGLPRDKVYGKKDHNSRHVLQQLGTEEGRDKYGPDVWVNFLKEKIIQYHARGIKYFFVTDIRFPNELDFFQNEMKGHVYRVIAKNRHEDRMNEEAASLGPAPRQSLPLRICNWFKQKFSGPKNIKTHISETALDKYNWAPSQIIYNDYKDAETVGDQIREKILRIRALPKTNTTVFIDLDDTVCECNIYYRQAVQKVCEMLNTLNESDTIRLDDFKREYVSLCSGRETFFKREAFANTLVSAAKAAGLTSFTQLENVREIGISVHNSPFTAIPGAVEKVKEIAEHFQVVLLTLGDPVDQIRKVYNLGLSNFQTECVTSKNSSTYKEMMRKYPSGNYFMIGDSEENDMKPALEAGFTNVYRITELNPLQNINYKNFHL